MDLNVAASWFDDTLCRDAYGTETFYAQLEPLDYYKLDGAAVKRRIMSTAPGVDLPMRRTIVIGNQVYLVGDGTPDEFEGDSLRMRYVMSGADAQVTVRSALEAIQGHGGTELWASIVFSKLETDERVSSVPVPEFQLFFGPQEDVGAHGLVIHGQEAYWVMSAYKAQSGLVSSTAVRLENPEPTNAQYVTSIYDPVSDTNQDTQTYIRVLTLRWTEDFKYVDEGTPKYAHGDQMMLALSYQVPNPQLNEKVVCGDTAWRIVSYYVEGAVTRLHVRRA